MTNGLREARRTVVPSALGFALVVTGCTEPTDSADPATSPGVENPSYDAEAPAPALTTDDITSRVTAFIDLGVPKALAIGLAFDAYLANGNDICPGARDVLVGVGNEGCTTSDGWFYAGIGWYYSSTSDVAGDRHTAMSHGGDYRVASPDGAEMTGGGGIILDYTESGEEIALTVETEGSYQDSQSDTWLAEGYSAISTYTASGTWGAITSELTGGSGIGDDFRFDFNHVISGETTECPWEPSGEIGIRDDAGYWYVWHHEADCDSCGTVTFEPTDEDLGEVCVEMGAYFAEVFFGAVPQ